MSHIMPLSQITYGIASIIYFSLFLALLYGALLVPIARAPQPVVGETVDLLWHQMLHLPLLTAQILIVVLTRRPFRNFCRALKLY
jgi:hypothetical protein